jgi:uncharacterized membrane protein
MSTGEIGTADGRPRAPAPLVRGLRAIEDAPALDRAAQALAGATAPLRRPDVARLLRGEWFGHALHPALTDVPLGMWMSANSLDLLLGRRGRPAATALVGLGLAAALPTVATGLAEWQATAGRARRVGVAHAAVNGSAVLLYAASLGARLAGRNRAGVGLGLAGGVAATAGGYLGSHLSLVHDVGTVDPRHRRRGPEAPAG